MPKVEFKEGVYKNYCSMKYDITTYKIHVPDSYDGPQRALVLTDIHNDINTELVRVLSDWDYDSMILSILVYTFFSRMFDLMLPPAVKHSIAVA